MCIRDSVTDASVSLLKSGMVDIAFGNLPINDDKLIVRECMEVHDIFVGSDAYSELYNREVSRQIISEYPLILLEKKSNSRRYIDNIFLSSGIGLIPSIELGAHELLLQFAKINLGISCVVREFSEQYLADGSVHEIKLCDPCLLYTSRCV